MLVYLFPQSLDSRSTKHPDQDIISAGLAEPFLVSHGEKFRGTFAPTATVEHVTIDGHEYLRCDPSLRGPLFAMITANMLDQCSQARDAKTNYLNPAAATDPDAQRLESASEIIFNNHDLLRQVPGLPPGLQTWMMKHMEAAKPMPPFANIFGDMIKRADPDSERPKWCKAETEEEIRAFHKQWADKVARMQTRYDALTTK